MGWVSVDEFNGYKDPTESIYALEWRADYDWEMEELLQYPRKLQVLSSNSPLYPQSISFIPI